MPYKAAILAAIEELKDYETGSPAAAIRRCIQDRRDDTAVAATTSHIVSDSSNISAMTDNAQYCDDASKAAAAAGFITNRNTTASVGGGGVWNETLFQSTLKSLLTKNILVQVNGSNYKYSDLYLKKRAERLREQMDLMEEEEQHRRHHHHHVQQQRHHHHSLSASYPPSPSAAAASAASSHTLYPREEPPKPSPKKKTLHAKVKMNEGKIITVVNPPSSLQHHRNANEMETEYETTMNNNNNNSTMILDADTKKESTKKQPHVKIIPRKVVAGAKKMISDPSIQYSYNIQPPS